MAYTTSSDLPTMDWSAHWHSVAPAPPPPPTTKDIKSQRTTSSASTTSLGFGRRTKGDDLPFDSHAPEPERPVSRNAVAKVREKERQRARTNSASMQYSVSQNHPPPSPLSQNSSNSYVEAGKYHPNPPMTRDRHDSSPAAASPWSMYPQQNTSGYVAPSGQYYAQPQQPYPQVNGWQQPAPFQQVYATPVQSPIDGSWSPSPSVMMTYPIHYPAPGPPSSAGAWVGSIGAIPQGYHAPIPFPTNMSMPPPPPPSSSQPITFTPTKNGSRPLPSPSRSSSQSSSVGTGSSSPSLQSISGTVRRSLPQPPGKPLSKMTMIDSPSLSRHDSVRMAAEEIMARGPPRRKNMSAGSRFGSNKIELKSNESITEASVGSDSIAVESQQPKPPVRIARAESSSCLEKEMREMKLNQERRQSVDVPSREIVRTASPRPIRAAPEPAPQVTIAAPIEDIIPIRPRSRGPKDEGERRKSTTEYGASNIPLIFSPPPDSKPPVPTFSFDQSPVISQSGMPSIIFPGDEVPTISIGEAPVIEVDSPKIHISDEDSDESDNDGPKASISISVSSSSVAQRSTTSTVQASTLKENSHHSHIHDLMHQSAPASASSIGSGASCATCQKWIGGRVVHAMSHTFHPDCFICCHCSEHLEHVAFYEHEGRPYCHFDYHELFSKRCFHCRTPIVDQRYITINDTDLVGGNAEERCYHDLHFFCANCGDPFLDPKVASSAAGSDPMDMIEDEDGKVRLGGREFIVYKGYPYCEGCHVNQHKPKCKGCKKPILETDFLTALKAKWHTNCFCCQICQNPIASENFFVDNGQAFDEECYKIKLRSEL